LTVRVGLIGAGVMGADHARTVQETISGAALVAVTDTDRGRALKLSQQLDTDMVLSDDDLIASPNVDAVIIASHDSAHRKQVLACIEAGKAVLCEKPLAPTVEECQQIVTAQRERALGNLVSVGFMRRFHPGFRAMKDRLATGVLGQPLMVLGSHRNVHASYPTGGSEGTLTNSAVHDIDITEWLLDSPVVQVGWYAPRPTSLDRTRDDPQLIHLRTADGVLASIDLFINAQYGYDVRYEVVCERGTVRLSPTAPVVTDHGRAHGYDHPDDWRAFFADAYRLELQAWVNALGRAQATPLATAADGLRCTVVAEALVQSMHSGLSVRVGDDVSRLVAVRV
jgi:myo-inositol 2-dehydrogenase / D-chiro-inositol 1-dehydrogenase